MGTSGEEERLRAPRFPFTADPLARLLARFVVYRGLLTVVALGQAREGLSQEGERNPTVHQHTPQHPTYPQHPTPPPRTPSQQLRPSTC